jgi:5-methylcytosine-specific restriction endonuclease McrA
MVKCKPSKLFLNVEVTFGVSQAHFALYYWPPGAHLEGRQKLGHADILLLTQIGRGAAHRPLYLHTADAGSGDRESPEHTLPRGTLDSPLLGVRSPSPSLVTPISEFVPMPDDVKHARNVPSRVRKTVAYDQAYCCSGCHELLPPGYQVDHVVSLDAGGTNDPSNLRAMCVACHDTKTGQEFHQLQQRPKLQKTSKGGKKKGSSKTSAM